MLLQENIKPISYIKSHASEILAKINETHNPVIITQNGEARAVLLDSQSYENMTTALNLLKLAAQGEKDILDKNYLDQNSFFNQFLTNLRKN